ncbi:FAD-dependent monooxygenase [Streptomyces roseicoloratus]|uniref:FAD-dependent monooxygenase n=1 Tax=Streptomyces roseicoloratus TaxID=2508722 RepID=A0ABY9RQU7_9ACTN|nr:FAD-dependent monooxygenase [Streptomyces roseicoloratus]WMX44546.1 FAD-dependent monooxygenase [Streptomyces roseicoloratus]
MTSAPTEQTPVLIVGGAVVGLSTALFLARRGIRPLLVERHPGALGHPRARILNPRTVEVFRAAGLEEEIFADRSLTSELSEKLMVRAETLAGPEIFSAPMQDEAPELTSEVTPCTWCSIDQDKLERIVAQRAAELGADLRWSTELVGFEQDEDGVTATLRDTGTGAETTVRTQYLIGADGVRSAVREAAGIAVEGPGTLIHTVSVVFKADLTEPLRGRDLGLGYFDQPDTGTLLMPLDGSRWVFYTPYHPERGERLEDFDEARCVEAIRAAIGVPDLAVEGLEVQVEKTGQKILGFEISAGLAARYRRGRVLLVGDAAHTMPPTGAFGAATGIQDADNLAWKLASVLHRTAGPGLLDSYEAERRPVARFTIDYALAELQERSHDGESDGRPSYAAAILGQLYPGGALLPEDGDTTEDGTALPPALDPRVLGRPGTRAPHVTVRCRGKELSALDLFGEAPVLLTGPDGTGWEHAAGPAAQRLGIDLDVYRIGGDFVTDPAGDWASRYGVDADGAVLVRPDGYVAWRSAGAAGQPQARLEEVLAQVLDRAPHA